MACGTKYLWILIISLSSCISKELPSFIQKCKLDYPAINDCVIQRVKDIKPYLEKGIPEMKLPALLPLKIPKVEVQTAGGFSATFVDLVVTGAEKFELPKVDFNLEKHEVAIDIYIPNIRVLATYKFIGKISILELNGNGPSDCNITNVNSKIRTSIKKVNKNGKEHIGVEDFVPQIKYDKPSLYFGDLFKGNAELTERTNQVINENISEIGKEIQPLIDDTIHKFVHGTVTQVFKDYSVDELFA